MRNMNIGTIGKISIIAFASFLIVISAFVITKISSAASPVTVNATTGPVAPSVGSITITNSNPAPGTTFYVAADVSDSNGRADIVYANVSCNASTGTIWTEGWDSIYRGNGSSTTWTAKDDSTYTINATFDASANYWSSKSISGTWTCQIYARDSTGLTAYNSGSMTVQTSSGISLGASACAFDTGNPGDNSKQWGCPTASNRNNTIQHDGNIPINITINATQLTGMVNTNSIIGVGNITWNQTTGAVPETEITAYSEFTGSVVNFITSWNRGILGSRTTNTTNTTVWLDYPAPLADTSYNGTITFNSFAS